MDGKEKKKKMENVSFSPRVTIVDGAESVRKAETK